MGSLLGVPILIDGATWGNLHLADTHTRGFTELDEQAVVILAQRAARVIENARIREATDRWQLVLEHAVRGLEATREIGDAIGADNDLDRVLELTTKRGRALIDARSVLIMLHDADALVVTISDSGQILSTGWTQRTGDVDAELHAVGRTCHGGSSRSSRRR
jgi:hypothetical protein